jgi:hypothetical protein
MTQTQLTDLYVHLACAEQTARDKATRYRIAEAKKLVSAELDKARQATK